MAQRAGRVVCPRCGANNFDTVSACWKCNAPLGAGAAAPMPATASPAPPAAAAQPVFSSPARPPASSSMPSVGAAVFGAAASVSASATGNPATANRAALWLGLLFPYFGIPLGLAFMMCDDRRRQEVGRICLMWSLLSTLVHALLFFVTLLGVREYVMAFLGAARSGMSRPGGLGGGYGGEF